MLKLRTLALLIPLGIASLTLADEPKATEKPAKDAAPAKVKPQAEAVGQVTLAADLVEYGRDQKAPEALITAARILGTLPEMKDVDQKPEVEKADKVTPATGEKHAARSDKPADLLAEAKKMSGDDASVVALADQVAKIINEKLRGVVTGPARVSVSIDPGDRNTWRFRYAGGEEARVDLWGDGASQLSLSIYDENGGRFLGPFEGTHCWAHWTPDHDAKYTIHVHNRGDNTTHYRVHTN